MYTWLPEDKFGRHQLNRRALVLGIAQGTIFSVIIGRLRYLQVTESEKLAGLADLNRINLRVIIPERGLIYDRNGTLLAENQKLFRIILVQEETNDPNLTIDQLGQILPLTPKQKLAALEKIHDSRQDVPVVIVEEASWEQIARVSANAPALPGVRAEVGERRHYPMGSNAVHVIGYVGKVSSEDLVTPKVRDPLLQVPDFRVGRSGIEKSLDHALRGRAGNQRIEVNAYGRVMRELGSIGAQHGTNQQLTIDSSQQQFAMARLGDHRASAVVMNIKTGDVISLASTPAFDPNPFVSGITQVEFDQIRNDQGKPMFNRSIQGTYPPGSTFKMITALAALEEGLIAPDEEVNCQGSIDISGRNFHCWKFGGHGNIDLHSSLRESCDVYYYNLAERVPLEKLAAVARRFGLGVRPELPMAGIEKGYFPTRESKLEIHNRPWSIGDMLNTSIGQGDVLATALQLTIMTARLASGLNVQPRLVLSENGKQASFRPFSSIGISESSLELVRNGMNAAVNHVTGTAFRSRTADESFLIAGKTGTSQVRTISQRERETGLISNEDLPLNQRDHALFCCYAPIGDPVFATAVIVENGGTGSIVAAPIARDLLMRAHYGGVPSLRMYPPEERDEVKRIFLNLNLPLSPKITPQENRPTVSLKA